MQMLAYQQHQVVNDKEETETGLGHAEVIDRLLVAVVIRQSAQCTSLMSAEKRKTIDVASVDPAES
jgi:hypothetical protein